MEWETIMMGRALDELPRANLKEIAQSAPSSPPPYDWSEWTDCPDTHGAPYGHHGPRIDEHDTTADSQQSCRAVITRDDVGTVMAQTGCNLATARHALGSTGGDVIESIVNIYSYKVEAGPTLPTYEEATGKIGGCHAAAEIKAAPTDPISEGDPMCPGMRPEPGAPTHLRPPGSAMPNCLHAAAVLLLCSPSHSSRVPLCPYNIMPDLSDHTPVVHRARRARGTPQASQERLLQPAGHHTDLRPVLTARRRRRSRPGCLGLRPQVSTERV
jgi:NACalpha-BTF3-like transcription factor